MRFYLKTDNKFIQVELLRFTFSPSTDKMVSKTRDCRHCITDDDQHKCTN